MEKGRDQRSNNPLRYHFQTPPSLPPASSAPRLQSPPPSLPSFLFPSSDSSLLNLSPFITRTIYLVYKVVESTINACIEENLSQLRSLFTMINGANKKGSKFDLAMNNSLPQAMYLSGKISNTSCKQVVLLYQSVVSQKRV